MAAQMMASCTESALCFYEGIITLVHQRDSLRRLLFAPEAYLRLLSSSCAKTNVMNVRSYNPLHCPSKRFIWSPVPGFASKASMPTLA